MNVGANLIVSFFMVAAGIFSLCASTDDAKYEFWHDRRVFVHDVNYDSEKIPLYSLEDPLMFVDGRKVRTSTDWIARRREILDLLSREMYGMEPPPPEVLITEEFDEKIVLNGLAVRKQYKMWFRSDRTGPCLTWIVWIPAKPKKKVPVILFLNYRGNHELVSDTDIPVQRGWISGFKHYSSEVTRGVMANPENAEYLPLKTIILRGYALMSACYAEASPDPFYRYLEPYAQYPFAYTGIFELWGKRDKKRTDNIAALGAWGWVLSRGLDLAGRIVEIDSSRSVVTGWSRLGKAALIAGARDTRFAVVSPVQTGGGGCPLLKRDWGENVSTLNRYFTHWFCLAFAKYAESPHETMPFDSHLLLSSIAPRALLVQGFNDSWYDTEGEYLAVKAASPVWSFLGEDGMPDVPWPCDNDESAIGGALGYVRRPGEHGMAADEWRRLMDFSDKIFSAR